MGQQLKLLAMVFVLAAAAQAQVSTIRGVGSLPGTCKAASATQAADVTVYLNEFYVCGPTNTWRKATMLTTAAPSNGQVPIYNVAASSYIPGDPIVSFNYVNLLTTAVATATASSATPVRVSTFSSYGTLYFTFAGITGSPATCTVQLKSADSLGNLINNGAAVAVTAANGTTSKAFTPVASLVSSAQMSATWACGTYPTAGTITVDFVPQTSTNDVASSMTAAVVPASAVYSAGNGSGNLTGITVCDTQKNISITADTQMITGTSAKHIYICQLNLLVSIADNVAVVSGTGTVCATGIAGVFGGTTAATGWNFAANGGISTGTGLGWVGRTVATGDNICILRSSAAQISGNIVYTVY
jgi:hypothetical protein